MNTAHALTQRTRAHLRIGQLLIGHERCQLVLQGHGVQVTEEVLHPPLALEVDHQQEGDQLVGGERGETLREVVDQSEEEEEEANRNEKCVSVR